MYQEIGSIIVTAHWRSCGGPIVAVNYPCADVGIVCNVIVIKGHRIDVLK